MRRDSERLADIIDACATVSRYTALRTQADFFDDDLFRDAVIRQLTIVGEAATNLSQELKTRYPELPWVEITGFRNRLVHDYFGFDLETAWIVAVRHLPELHAQIAGIVEREGYAP